MKGSNRSSTDTRLVVLSFFVAVLAFLSVAAIVPTVLILSTPGGEEPRSLVATSVNPASANIGESHVNMTICVDSVGGLDSSARLEVLLWYAGRDVFHARDARANDEGTEITCWFDFSKPDMLEGAYHLSVYWAKANWVDNGLEECFALEDPEHDSAEDSSIDSYDEICMNYYYQVEVSGQVVGEERCSCEGRGVIHRGMDGKHDFDYVQYELLYEDLYDEKQCGQTFTRTYLEEATIYEQVIYCDEEYGDCPIFEPEYAGLMQVLYCNYFWPDIGQIEQFDAIIPSLGDEKVEVRRIDTTPGFNIAFLVVPLDVRIYASFNPETGGLVRVAIPSRDMEIYHANIGKGKSGLYYITLAHIYLDQAHYPEAIENAEKALEVNESKSDAAEAIIREAEESIDQSTP